MGVVSESGISRRAGEGIVQVPAIRLLNAKIFADHRGYIAGQSCLSFKDRDSVRAVQFPGPQGSGWAEAARKASTERSREPTCS